MIHYHGLPITPISACFQAINGGHAFISFRYPSQIGIVVESCQSFAVDNGAFSAWKSGNPVYNWSGYYKWIADLHRYPSFDFAVIPDVIDGNEADNDALLDEWPWGKDSKTIGVGAPVWHMHESLDRLQRLAYDWPRVCIGSSGQYATVGDKKWWNRIAEAMNVICDKEGLPICKLHGLRMLNSEIFTKLPFSSADSTNIARNIGIDSAWRGTYQPPNKDIRALALRQRIEANQAATFWDKTKTQIELF